MATPEGLLPFIATVFAGFFAIMNPITNTPIFLATLGVHMLTLGTYGSVVEGIRFVAEHH